jgi:membrane protein YdbS with pleckstrin-like domain
MEIFKTIISIFFLMTSVFFVVKSIEKLQDPRAIIIRLVAIVLSTLVALFAIDIVVFYNQHSMRSESRDKILQMVAGVERLRALNDEETTKGDSCYV